MPDLATELITSIPSTAFGSNNIVLGNNSNVSSMGNICAGNLGMFRNRIINGDMKISQRYGTGAVTSGYCLDRWQNAGYSTTLSAQQVSIGSTLPGFTTAMQFTQAAGGNAGSNSYFIHHIEGYNIADLNWGTTIASPVTVSFWANTSVAGTYGLALRNAAATASYAADVVLPANQWKYVATTIPGDSNVGSWSSDINIGMSVFFTLSATTGLKTAPSTWATGNFVASTNVTNTFSATTGATFQVTGVQLEKGRVATPFEFRPYGIELQLCLRYFWKWGGTVSNEMLGAGVGDTPNRGDCILPFPVTMRTAPAVTASLPGYFNVYVNEANKGVGTSFGADCIGLNSCRIYLPSSAGTWASGTSTRINANSTSAAIYVNAEY